MKTLFGLLCVLLAALAFAPAVEADQCNCSVSGICVCHAGQCQCPNCPGRVVRTVKFYPVPVIVAPPQYVAPIVPAAPQVQYYYQPQYVAPQSNGGCYRDPYGNWVCPNSQPALTGGQRRALRRAERRGLFSGLFGWGE